MTPAEIVNAARQNQVTINLDGDKVKLAGYASAVRHWAPIIAEQKAEIIDLLSKPEDPLPGWCSESCPHFERLPGGDPGCVQDHGDYEEWLRLDKLAGCPEVKQ